MWPTELTHGWPWHHDVTTNSRRISFSFCQACFNYIFKVVSISFPSCSFASSVKQSTSLSENIVNAIITFLNILHHRVSIIHTVYVPCERCVTKCSNCRGDSASVLPGKWPPYDVYYCQLNVKTSPSGVRFTKKFWSLKMLFNFYWKRIFLKSIFIKCFTKALFNFLIVKVTSVI